MYKLLKKICSVKKDENTRVNFHLFQLNIL